ncbi:MAG: hypothetical protein OSJ70_00640 [Bacilli bacterium]|mgnify:CR=1 FL=1|nr:hypothetical protein [Bacilli bacterium]
MSVPRRRQYEIVLPMEDMELFELQKQNILENFSCLYAKHDHDFYTKDVYDDDGNLIHQDGDDKYLHTHFFIDMVNAKSISAVSKIVKCKETDIQFIKTRNGAIKYLIHYNLKDKYNYSKEIVQHNNIKLYKEFEKLVQDELEEDDKVIPLIEYINEFEGMLYFAVFLRYVYTTRQWSTYRRNASTFIKLIDEHNFQFNRYGITP